MKNILKNISWVFAILGVIMLVIGIICGAFKCELMGIKYGTSLWMGMAFAQFSIMSVLLYFAMDYKAKE
jgi:hypothetical protein